MTHLAFQRKPSFVQNPLSVAVAAVIASLTMAWPMAVSAADITPNGLTSTKVTTSSKGATVIQIAPAKSDGSSYNGFTNFSATNTKGTVFNNNTQSSTTTTWGTIAGNTALGGVAATAIIAEVTGTQASTLSAGIGINGQSASLVLVNPNGITVNGKVTTTNVTQATLAVGGINQSNGLATAIDTSKAKSGASLTVNNALSNPTGALALLAPTIKIASAGSVSAASGAEVMVGVGRATFDPRSARLLSADASAPTTVSVDASLLGAMNAGVINIVSTRNGAGVNTSGKWTTQSGTDIQAQGNVVMSSHNVTGALDVTATQIGFEGSNTVNGDVQLQAAQDITAASSSLSGTNVNLLGGRDINLNATNISASQNLSLNAARDVNIGVVTVTTETTDPTVSNDTSSMNMTSSLGLLGVNVGGSAKFAATYSAGKTSTTTQTVSSLTAGQDVSIAADNVATLTGTVISAKGNASIVGRNAVYLMAAQDSMTRSTVSMTLQGSGKVSGYVPYLLGKGTISLTGSVTGTAVGEQTQSTTAKAVRITAGKDALVESVQGDFLGEGVSITAANNARVNAAGHTTLSVATSTSSSLKESGIIKGTVKSSVQVSSALKILSGLFTGGSLIDNVQIDKVTVAGKGTGTITGNWTATQNGGAITAGQTATVTAGNTLTTVGTDIKANTIQVSGTQETRLGAALNSVAKVNLSGSGKLTEQNILSGKLKIDLQGDLGASISMQGRGTQLQGANVQVSTSGGMTATEGVIVTGTNVNISGKNGVEIGTNLDFTGSASATFAGPLDVTITGLNLSVSKPSLGLSGGILSVSVPKIDASLNAVVNMAIAGTAKGQMSFGGKASQITASQNVNLTSTHGAISINGSKIVSTGNTLIQAAQGVNMGSALRLSGSIDGQFDVGMRALFDMSLDMQDLVISQNLGTVGLSGNGLASGLNVGVGGLTTNSSLQLGVDLSIGGTGSATLGGDTSSINAGQDVLIAAGGAVSLTRPNIQAGGALSITGRSVSMSALQAATLTGNLSVSLPLQLLPTFEIDWTKLDYTMGYGFQTTMTGGTLSATRGITLDAQLGGIRLAGATLSTPGAVSMHAASSISLEPASSLSSAGEMSYQATRINAGTAVALLTPTLSVNSMAPAVITSPVITLNGQPQ